MRKLRHSDITLLKILCLRGGEPSTTNLCLSGFWDDALNLWAIMAENLVTDPEGGTSVGGVQQAEGMWG